MSGNDQTMVGSVDRPSLRVTLSDGKQFVEILVADEMRVGRSLDSDLVLEDAGISRKHARICLLQGQWHVQDMQSANGVFVNAAKVQDAVLSHGDELGLGNARITFIHPGPPAPAAHEAGAAPWQSSETRTVMKRHAAAKKNRRAPAQGGAAGPKSQSGRESGRASGRTSMRKALIAGVAALGGALALVAAISFWAGENTDPSQPVDSHSASPSTPTIPSLPDPDFSGSETDPDLGGQKTVDIAPSPPHAPAEQIQDQARDSVREQARELAAIHAQAAQIYYDSGRLPDAVAQWAESLALDPSNEVVRIKLETTREELVARADESYAMGIKNFEFLNYEEAIRNWNYVMHLIPDPEHPLHQNALRNVEQARARMRR